MDLKKQFGDVRYVIMQGSADRSKEFAEFLSESLNLSFDGNPIGKTERYSLYKVGHVLCLSHGMGMPSISIALNEIYKLLFYAECLEKCVFIRCGTCGGLGVKPGTIAISTECCDTELNHSYSQSYLGQRKRYPAIADKTVVETLQSLAQKHNIPIVSGYTMSADGFYEDQGRTDGFFCDYDEKDKFAFLQKLRDAGVCNIEMEALLFLAFAYRAGVRAGVVCTVIVNRLLGDQVTATGEELEDYMKTNWRLLSYFVSQ